MDNPTGALTSFGKGPHERIAVIVITENLLKMISPIHHMINRSRKLNAWCSRHIPRLRVVVLEINDKKWTDPYG